MSKERIKDKAKYTRGYYEGLAPDLKNFYDEYFDLTGNYLTLTSGRRKAEDGVGKYSKISKHNTGEAFDFSASNVNDYNYLMNTAEGLSLLTKYDLGILDETTEEALKKTGGTDAHYHLGKDSIPVKRAKERLASMFGGEVVSNTSAPSLNNPKSAFIETQEFTSAPEVRAMEKEFIKETKEEQDGDRKELVQETNKYEQAQQLMSQYRNLPISTMNIEPNNTQQAPILDYSQVSIQDFQPERFIYQNT